VISGNSQSFYAYSQRDGQAELTCD